MDFTVSAIVGVCSAVLGGGAAWGANRVEIKNLKERIKHNEGEFDVHAAADHDHYNEVTNRLTAIEIKLDQLLERT